MYPTLSVTPWAPKIYWWPLRTLRPGWYLTMKQKLYPVINTPAHVSRSANHRAALPWARRCCQPCYCRVPVGKWTPSILPSQNSIYPLPGEPPHAKVFYRHVSKLSCIFVAKNTAAEDRSRLQYPKALWSYHQTLQIFFIFSYTPPRDIRNAANRNCWAHYFYFGYAETL